MFSTKKHVKEEKEIMFEKHKNISAFVGAWLAFDFIGVGSVNAQSSEICEKFKSECQQVTGESKGDMEKIQENYMGKIQNNACLQWRPDEAMAACNNAANKNCYLNNNPDAFKKCMHDVACPAGLDACNNELM